MRCRHRVLFVVAVAFVLSSCTFFVAARGDRSQKTESERPPRNTTEAADPAHPGTATATATTTATVTEGPTFLPFFPPPQQSDKQQHQQQCPALSSKSRADEVAAFFAAFKASKRTVCSVTNNKDVSAKIFEFTADFAGTKLSVQQHVRVRAGSLFDPLEDITCEEADSAAAGGGAGDSILQLAANALLHRDAHAQQSPSVFLTNAKGEHVTPEWLHIPGLKQETAATEEVTTTTETEAPQTTTTTVSAATDKKKKKTKRKKKRDIIAGGENDDDEDAAAYTRPASFNMWEHGPGSREPTLVIRVERAEPGNVLSNLETAFNIFLAQHILGGTTAAGTASYKLVFRDRASLYWGDVTVLQRMLADSQRNLVYFDSPARKAEQQRAASDQAKQSLSHAAARAAENLRRRVVEAKLAQAGATMPTADEAGATGPPRMTVAGWDTPVPPDPAQDVVEFSNLVEFTAGFPFTAVVASAAEGKEDDTNNGRASSTTFVPAACPSSLLQSFVEWYGRQVGVPIVGGSGAENPRRDRDTARSKLRVLWCSRQPQKGLIKRREMYLPARRLQDEMQFLIDLADELGTGVQLRSLDFGDRGDVHESVASVRDVDVLVGVHGAGLAWSAFMRPGEAALVEVFTDDLGETLAAASPYRRIAALAGLQYASARMHGRYHEPPFDLPFPGEQREIAWTAEDVARVAEAIKRLRFSRALPETKEWCK